MQYAFMCKMNIHMYHVVCLDMKNECLHVPCLFPVLSWIRQNYCPDIVTFLNRLNCHQKWALKLTLVNTIAQKCYPMHFISYSSLYIDLLFCHLSLLVTAHLLANTTPLSYSAKATYHCNWRLPKTIWSIFITQYLCAFIWFKVSTIIGWDHIRIDYKSTNKCRVRGSLFTHWDDIRVGMGSILKRLSIGQRCITKGWYPEDIAKYKCCT